MYRFLLTFFTLFLLEIHNCSFRQVAFADDDDNSESSESSESDENSESSENDGNAQNSEDSEGAEGTGSTESTEDDENKEQSDKGKSENTTAGSKTSAPVPVQKKKEHVRSIVDSILKINNNIDHSKKRKESPKKPHNKSEKDSENKDDSDTSDDSKSDAGKDEKKTKNSQSSQKIKKNKQKEKGNAYSSKRVYTIKKIFLPKNATNKYLSRTSGTSSTASRIKTYKNHVRSDKKAGTYTVKSYGSNVRPKTTAPALPAEHKPDERKPEEKKQVRRVSECFSVDGCKASI